MASEREKTDRAIQKHNMNFNDFCWGYNNSVNSAKKVGENVSGNHEKRENNDDDKQK